MTAMYMTLHPRVSEKSYGLSQERRTYVFVVPKNASKLVVASAVSEQFKVAVEKVNMTNVVGKAKRTIRKGGRVTRGKDNDFKKAYVTLKEGDSLPVFASEDDAKAEAAKGRAKKEEK